MLFAGKSGMKRPYVEGKLRKLRNGLKKSEYALVLAREAIQSGIPVLSLQCRYLVRYFSQTIASTIRATGMLPWLFHVEHISCLILNYL